MAGRGPLSKNMTTEEEYNLEAARERKVWWRGFIGGAIFSIGLVVAICIFGQPSAVSIWRDGGLTPSQAESLVNKVDLLFRKLDENYLEELDDNELLDGAYHGLMSAVGDKYTRYYDEEEYKEYRESSTGQYVGIGVTVRLAENGGAEITAVEETGPAYEVGLSVGDIIIGADGTDLKSMELEGIVGLI